MNTYEKCLVLGGDGFTGQHLIPKLVDQGYQVRAFTNNLVHQPDDARIEWCRGNFLDKNRLLEVVQGCDLVVQLISTTKPAEANQNKTYDIETNLAGNVQLLDVMVECGVKKFVFASSGGTVYGIPQYTPIDENHPTNPISSYGITKLAIEKHIQSYRYLNGINSSILRISNSYGEGQSPSSGQGAIAAFLYRALTKEPIEIWGDGSVVRDYIYIEDVADAIIASFAYDGPHNVFNIGSGEGKSLLDLIAEIENISKNEVEIKFKLARGFDVPVNVLDISRALENLQWKPTTSLSTGINRAMKSMWSELIEKNVV